jgi:LuxR family maltose regulon positive regulatory protein
LGDFPTARVLLSEAEALLPQSPDSPALARHLDLVRHLAGSGGAGRGSAGLTAAEQRVLRLLSTHMTFAEIADALFVSRNTVKTQAISAYRKLGVRSRSAAVEKARALGLGSPGRELPGLDSP